MTTLNPEIRTDEELEDDVIVCNRQTALKLIKLFTDYQSME